MLTLNEVWFLQLMTSNPTQPISLISAMSSSRVIGSGDGMPWDVPEEYQHFLNTTRGQTLIIGRKSFEIFGPTLTSKRCFVITRSGRCFESAVAVASIDDAINQSRDHDERIFVAGGASVYSLALPLADEMQLSYIRGTFTGDTYFPEFDESDWGIVRQEDRGSYEFVHYKRTPSA